MAEPVWKGAYKGELVQCAKCKRVVGADQVNERKRCETCSPPHGAPEAEDDTPG